MIRSLLVACFVLASTLSLTTKVQAQSSSSFLPENTFWIPVQSHPTNEMTEELFHSILDQVVQVYTPIFQANGLKFVVQRDWRDGTVNAYAQRMGSNAIIKMFGGLARHPAVTPDAFALVACHEVGHHLGGAPRVSTWASNEGQSDYFGTAKCLRKLFERSDSVAVLNYIWGTQRFLIPPTAVEACQYAHNHPQVSDICIRSAAAGLSLGNMFADLRRLPQAPAIETPDPTVVSRTSNSHPGAQCRVDTYFQGALCPIPHLVDVDPRDYRVGTCNRAEGHPFGLRPLCWFAPGK